ELLPSFRRAAASRSSPCSSSFAISASTRVCLPFVGLLPRGPRRAAAASPFQPPRAFAFLSSGCCLAVLAVQQQLRHFSLHARLPSFRRAAASRSSPCSSSFAISASARFCLPFVGLLPRCPRRAAATSPFQPPRAFAFLSSGCCLAV